MKKAEHNRKSIKTQAASQDNYKPVTRLVARIKLSNCEHQKNYCNYWILTVLWRSSAPDSTAVFSCNGFRRYCSDS